MTTPSSPTLDPRLDLVLSRFIDVPPALVWKVWTEPEHLKQWFVPRPWSLSDCELELRPGGMFRSVIRSPEGAEFPSAGCFLEIETGRRLVWTSALLPGFRPAPPSEGPVFTAIITMEPEGTGTRYVATAMHRDEDGRSAHAAMGFQEGWGKALDQLVELARTLPSS